MDVVIVCVCVFLLGVCGVNGQIGRQANFPSP